MRRTVIANGLGGTAAAGADAPTAEGDEWRQKAPVTEKTIRPHEMQPPSGTLEKLGCSRW
jgi:hypothetical protein